MRKTALLLAILAAFLTACRSNPKPPPKPPTIKKFRLVHQAGGTHYRALVHNGVWYQTFGGTLLVFANHRIEPVTSIALGKPGEVGAVIDMMLHRVGNGGENDQRLFLVIEDDELVEVSLARPVAPEIVARVNADQLGIQPRRLSVVDRELYISGIGGVVRYRDRKKIFTSDEDISRLAHCDFGLIACIGRRAFRLDDGRYVGSATDVWNLQTYESGPSAAVDGTANATHPASPATIIFARQGEQNVLVGLMNAQAREVDAIRATVSVPGQLGHVQQSADRLWIATDAAVRGYSMRAQALTDPIHIDLMGARDAVPLSANYLAIAGTFGRAVYRLNADGKAPGETFVQVHREPSRLSQALTDGRHILAGSREGLWMYLINARAELTARQFDAPPIPPALSASVAGAQASINENQRTITITPSGDTPTSKPSPFTYSDRRNARLRTVVAIDGDFWVGHDRGITVLRGAPVTPGSAYRSVSILDDRVLGHLRCDGPVMYIYPLLVGGGASFVSEYGGFGVAKFVEEPLPVNEPRQTRQKSK